MNKAMLVEHMAKMTKMPKSDLQRCLEAFISSCWCSIKEEETSCSYWIWYFFSYET